MTEEELTIQLGDAIQPGILEEPLPWQDGVIPFGLPGDARTMVFLKPSALTVITKHGKSSVDKEVMGILLGHVFDCPVSKKRYDKVEAAIPSKLAKGTGTRVEFDHDAWAEVLAQKEILYPSMRIIGWYHTHPNLGAFYSSADEFCHKFAFPMAWQIGFTYDPTNNSGAFFGWDNDTEVALLEGFYELLEPNYTFSRIANLGINWDFKRITVKRQERPGKASSHSRNINTPERLQQSTPLIANPEPVRVSHETQRRRSTVPQGFEDTAKDGSRPGNCLAWRRTLIIILILLLIAIGILLFNLPNLTFPLIDP
jgi:proteasome lid subunit RPN8/RPN11